MFNLKVMGVINFTPDSFSDGSDHLDQNRLQQKLINNSKASIFDFGAESTAAMNAPITYEQELLRYSNHLDFIFSVDKVVSIDTYHPETIAFFQDEWIKRGKKNPLVWNDVSGKIDDEVERFIEKGLHFEYVFCHNLAPTRALASYHMEYLSDLSGDDYLTEITSYLTLGKRDQFILDPCLGFSKTFEQNWNILENFRAIQDQLNHPKWLIGFSRKSFLRKKYSLSGEREDRQQLDEIHVKEFLKLSQKWRDEVWLRTHRPELISL